MNWKILTTFLIAISFFFGSCNQAEMKFPQAEVADLPEIDFAIHRYGKTLFELDTINFQQELKSIREEYSIFLNADLNDTSNIQQLYTYVTDTQLISIYEKSVEVYPNTYQLENELSDAFARHHYFFPNNTIPKVYTYISDLYYELPIWIKNDILVIAIDLYLGDNFPLYFRLGLPQYKIRCMSPENLPVDVMKAMYFNEVALQNKPKTLLDRMVDGGKLLVYLDAVLPGLPDEIKICYTKSQMNWAIENEENVWAFLVSNNLLYTTDYQAQTKLIQDGPFTTGFGNQSPSRLGIFMGWNIVIDFLNNNPDVSLEELMKINDSQKILQESRYKP